MRCERRPRRGAAKSEATAKRQTNLAATISRAGLPPEGRDHLAVATAQVDQAVELLAAGYLEDPAWHSPEALWALAGLLHAALRHLRLVQLLDDDAA